MKIYLSAGCSSQYVSLSINSLLYCALIIILLQLRGPGVFVNISTKSTFKLFFDREE